jgi:pentatricopeptide repeat protein
LSKARKAEVALELFNHMKAAGIQPSSVTYGAVIVSNQDFLGWIVEADFQNACCRVGDAQSAETLFEEMVSMSNFKPRVPPYK